jgi:hypothetical protein
MLGKILMEINGGEENCRKEGEMRECNKIIIDDALLAMRCRPYPLDA